MQAIAPSDEFLKMIVTHKCAHKAYSAIIKHMHKTTTLGNYTVFKVEFVNSDTKRIFNFGLLQEPVYFAVHQKYSSNVSFNGDFKLYVHKGKDKYIKLTQSRKAS